MPGGCVRGDAQRVGEDGGWCLADELVPCGQPARPGRNAQPAKDGDELTVAAMFAGELPGKQPRRGRTPDDYPERRKERIGRLHEATRDPVFPVLRRVTCGRPVN